jgi:hypothetical protein
VSFCTLAWALILIVVVRWSSHFFSHCWCCCHTTKLPILSTLVVALSWWHSSLTLLFVFHVTPHAPPWRHSSLTLLVLFLFNNPPLWCCYCFCFSLTLFFLLFFNATPISPCSSYFRYLFVPPWCCHCSFFMLLLFFLFHIGIPLPTLSCFCRCGRTKLSKFNFFRPDLKVRLFFFKCLFVDDSLLVLIIHIFFG